MQFVSWHPEPGTQAVDAFCFVWKQIYLYIFPLFSLEETFLKEIIREGAKAILIVSD